MIRIANVFDTWGLVGKILGAVLAPILFGFAGAIVLTVTGVRHYRRSQRQADHHSSGCCRAAPGTPNCAQFVSYGTSPT